jgi:Ferredoxin-like domain in Api92-like protein
MPNWCLNKLTVTGPEADVQAFKAKAVGHSPWLQPEGEPDVINFHSLVPVPQEVLKAGYESAGYDWEVENWGCKWGAENPTILAEWEGFIAYEFSTAWSPPEQFLQTVAVQWPKLMLILEYEEPGMAYKGLAKFQGNIHEDHCISL